jgi:cysteine desulfurase
VIIGGNAPRLANTTAVALPGKLAETLVIRLDLAGIAVSAGSACSSGKVGASHVLEAMGLGHDIASSTIRVSLGPTTTEDDIAAFLAAWKTIAGAPALAA